LSIDNIRQQARRTSSNLLGNLEGQS
jgi:hypothetical protein